MKHIILAITVSLMVPAYAIDNTNLMTATDKLGACMKKVASEGRPLPEADRLAFKEALDNFYKEANDYYQLDAKPVKKKGKSPIKVFGKGLWNTAGLIGRAGSGGYGNSSAYGGGLGMPVIHPVTVNGQPGSITNLGGFTSFNGPAFGGY